MLLVLLPSWASAGRPAQLPPHFEHVASHHEDEYYSPVPNLRGIYAYGVTGVRWSQEWDGPPCVGTAEEQENVLGSVPFDGDTEFWFYGTPSQGVLFSRAISFDSTKPCAGAKSVHYSLERAWVAGGFIHSVSVGHDNSFEPQASEPVSHSAEEYSGSFGRIQSLMARTSPSKKYRRQSVETIAGFRAECRGMSGLVWSTVCIATASPVKGMLLRARAGDDERESFSNNILTLEARRMSYSPACCLK